MQMSPRADPHRMLLFFDGRSGRLRFPSALRDANLEEIRFTELFYRPDRASNEHCAYTRTGIVSKQDPIYSAKVSDYEQRRKFTPVSIRGHLLPSENRRYRRDVPFRG
jgi:hypothetical protein